LGRENREIQSRFDLEQAQAASEKLAMKNSLKSLEATNGQMQAENSGLRVLLDRARKEIEDMSASWDRAKEQIAELQKELAEVQQANQELTDQKQKVLKTVQALEDMLRQAKVTKPD
jgi:chromosome segregation ATPase